jgi:CheY-like chemotaxis protein
MNAALQTFSFFSLFTHGILLGALSGGFILMLLLFNARSRLHLAVLISAARRRRGESRDGEDTAFSVCLPVGDEKLPAPAPPPARQPHPRIGRVLYLEDESAVAALGKKMFAALGLEADTCARGEEAAALFRKALDEGRPYSFVLLDVLVAGGRGAIETARELRRLDPWLIAAATSGYSDGDIALQHKKYGFSAFLPKPFQLSDLKNLTDKLLGGRAAAQR